MTAGEILDIASNASSGPPQLSSASTTAANSTSLANIVPAIQNFANAFAANVNVVTLTLDNAALDIAKAAVVFLIIFGALLWFSRLGRRLGKDLVQGGIIIGLFIEFVVPFLMSIRY